MNLVERLNEWLCTEEPRDPNREKTHSPSKLTACKRSTWYRWNNIEKSDPPGPEACYKMQMGSYVELMIYDWLAYEQSRFWIDDLQSQYEFYYSDPALKFRFHGFIDFVFSDAGETIGIELKTTSSYGLRDVKKQGLPKHDHIMQVACYLRFSEIKQFVVMYFARDTGEYQTFDMTIADDETIMIDGKPFEIEWDHVIDHLRSIEEHYESGDEPPRDFNAVIVNGEFKRNFTINGEKICGDWQCMYCNWRSKCWSDVLEQQGKFRGQEKMA